MHRCHLCVEVFSFSTQHRYQRIRRCCRNLTYKCIITFTRFSHISASCPRVVRTKAACRMQHSLPPRCLWYDIWIWIVRLLLSCYCYYDCCVCNTYLHCVCVHNSYNEEPTFFSHTAVTTSTTLSVIFGFGLCDYCCLVVYCYQFSKLCHVYCVGLRQCSATFVSKKIYARNEMNFLVIEY